MKHERVRAIYKYALEKLPKESSQDIYKAFTIHEKKYGDRIGIENIITDKRKKQYNEVRSHSLLEHLGISRSLDFCMEFFFIQILETSDSTRSHLICHNNF
jgi:hypothetical protein